MNDLLQNLIAPIATIIMAIISFYFQWKMLKENHKKETEKIEKTEFNHRQAQRLEYNYQSKRQIYVDFIGSYSEFHSYKNSFSDVDITEKEYIRLKALVAKHFYSALFMADSKNIELLKKNKFKILTGQLEEYELEYIIGELEADFYNASKQWDTV